MQLGNNANSGPLSPNASLVIADCQATGESDDLAVLVTLTLGTDATSSTISSKLMNLTDGTETVIGSYTGINSNVYSAATTNIYGFIHAQTLTTTGSNAITQVQVSSVTMAPGNTLNTNSFTLSEFGLSQNPVKDQVELSGLNMGTTINIYNLIGSKVNSYIYDGSPLSLGHLNSGIYIMEVSGFSAKKLIKK